MLLIVMTILGFLAIEVWWFSSQREVVITEHQLIVRSWIQALMGRGGECIPLQEITRAALVVDAGKKLLIESDSGPVLSFWVGLWEADSLRELVTALDRIGIPTSMAWDP